MSRGSYRQLARVEGPGPITPDGEGGFTESWVPLEPPAWWCAIATGGVRNNERVTEQTITTSASHLLTGDFHPQLSTASRIWIPDPDAGTDRRFDVVSVTRQGERRFTLLVACTEYQNPDDPRATA